MTETIVNNFESQLEVNDIVQVQSTVSDVEVVGLLGYVSEVLPSVIKVAFYHAQVKGENAYVDYRDFLRPELYFVGRPNPDLLPC